MPRALRGAFVLRCQRQPLMVRGPDVAELYATITYLNRSVNARRLMRTPHVSILSGRSA